MRKIMGLCEDFTNKTLDMNNDEYNLYFDYYGDSPKSLMWMTKGSQDKNFKLVSKHIENGDSILDYGCGTGDLLNYLNKQKIDFSKYLGVDINDNFINAAKKNHPKYDFEIIDSIKDLNGKYDTICAIGVFTWYITKKEFVEIINKLHDMANKQVILTLLNGKTPYDKKTTDKKEEEKYWGKDYRFYNENLFKNFFPDFNINYEYDDSTMLVIINKNA